MLDAYEIARVAEKYSNGEIRLTVEQNIIFPNVPNDQVPEMLKDPFFAGRFSVNPSKSLILLISMYVGRLGGR